MSTSQTPSPTSPVNAIYYNADGAIELVELDSTDCILTVVSKLSEDEALAVHAGETPYRVVGHRVEIGDGDAFYRLGLR